MTRLERGASAPEVRGEAQPALANRRRRLPRRSAATDTSGQPVQRLQSGLPVRFAVLRRRQRTIFPGPGRPYGARAVATGIRHVPPSAALDPDVAFDSRAAGGRAHVTLIRPAMVTSTGSWNTPVTPPLGLAYLAAVLEQAAIRVTVVDAIAEGIDDIRQSDGYDYQGLTVAETVSRIAPDATLVGVSCMFTQDWPFLRRLIAAIRERFPTVPIVAGGEHITALPEFSLRDAPGLDLCVLGEGEATLVELATVLRPGTRRTGHERLAGIAGLAMLDGDRLVITPPRARIRLVDQLPQPAWHLFPMEAYLSSRNAHGVYLGRSIGILATRGCPYKCTFCSNPLMYGNLWLARDPGDVLDEIDEVISRYRVENVDFYDLTMIVRRRWVLEFCRLIEERGLDFHWQLPTGTRSEVIDAEVSAALYRTGCRSVTYAPESGSPETLAAIKKQVNLAGVSSSVRDAVRAGITVKCNLIIGFPHERRRHVWQTMRFAWRLALVGASDVGVYLFSPYPGSALFDELRGEGRIGALDDEYFRSLLAFMDPLAPSRYCRHLGPGELRCWRLAIIASFFAISFTLRPWRLVRLVRNVAAGRGETALAKVLSGILHRRRLRRSAMGPSAVGQRSPGASDGT